MCASLAASPFAFTGDMKKGSRPLAEVARSTTAGAARGRLGTRTSLSAAAGIRINMTLDDRFRRPHRRLATRLASAHGQKSVARKSQRIWKIVPRISAREAPRTMRARLASTIRGASVRLSKGSLTT